MICTFLFALGLITKAFILNESIKVFLVIFFGVGCAVGLLRLFVNYNIKKMKGKSLARKIIFFAILLGIGLPFQNWFRVNVLFSMERSYLPWTISMMVCGAVFITIFYGFIKSKLSNKEKNQANEVSKAA
jgi:hypothetical protein